MGESTCQKSRLFFLVQGNGIDLEKFIVSTEVSSFVPLITFF